MFLDVRGACYVDGLTFVRVKLHLPVIGPLLKLTQISLESKLVSSRPDSRVDNRVIGKESDLWGDVAIDVIDEHQKQEGA